MIEKLKEGLKDPLVIQTGSTIFGLVVGIVVAAAVVSKSNAAVKLDI